jgi:hypothetical protein
LVEISSQWLLVLLLMVYFGRGIRFDIIDLDRSRRQRSRALFMSPTPVTEPWPHRHG